MLIVKDVEKSYGDKKVIDGLSFYVRKGECAALIGLNGAGKTTMIRMLTGSLLPEKGTIRVNKLEPYFRQKELISHIGMVSATYSQLWAEMPLRYSLENCREMYSISKSDYEQNIEELDYCMALKNFWETKVKQLSLGQKMLGELAYTLLRKPSVLFLDEPTIGLAVDVKNKVLQYINEMNEQNGATVFYTGHNMKDIEKLCNHIILIDKGKKLFDGSIEKLQHEYGVGDCLELKLEKGKFPDLEDLPLEKYRYDEDCLTIYYQKAIVSNSIILEHIRKQCRVLGMKTREASLEETIRFITERQK